MKTRIIIFAACAGLCSIVPAQQPAITAPPMPFLQVSNDAETEMQLQTLVVDARVNGLFATVESTMTFHNPHGRDLAGTLVFPLPDGAAVCGYALDINGQLVDGVIVPKEKARVAFETETRRQVDPGLVEHVKGNVYRTRIYPLPANGSRTIRLAYHTPLPLDAEGNGALFLPVPAVPIDRLSVKIQAATASGAPELGGLGERRFEQAGAYWLVESGTITNHPVGEAIWLALPRLPKESAAVETTPDGETWFVISALAPEVKTTENAPPSTELFVAWDASGSRLQSNLAKELETVEALLAEKTRIHLLLFRNTPEPIVTFDNAPQALEHLRNTFYDGGTDIHALQDAITAEGPWALFTDGLDTLSDSPFDFENKNVTAFISAAHTDAESLRQACRGRVMDLRTLTPEQAAKRFHLPAIAVDGIQGTGIADLQGIGAPATGRMKLLGRLLADEATLRIRYTDGSLSAPFHLQKTNAATGTLLATAWAVSRIQQLTPRATIYEDELLALGRKYGLVSPVTSLITLETLAQWIRHEIEPPETLPHMRQQWQDAMANRNKQRSTHINALERRWSKRVNWWNKKSKNNENKPIPNDGEFHIVSDSVSPIILKGLQPGAMQERRSSSGRALTVAAFGSSRSEYTVHEEMDMIILSDEAFTEDEALPERVALSASLNLEIPEENTASTPKAAARTPRQTPAGAIQIQAWNPETPYLHTLKAAAAADRSATYLALRADYVQSPSFFLDCADFFFQQDDPLTATRILTNLAEMEIEDAALLRIFAWRLRQAGEYESAARIFRRILRLRGEEPQSYRDLALILAEIGKATRNPALLEEAIQHLHTIIHKNWGRHGDAVALFALEERNALAAWIQRQTWENGTPVIPELPIALTKNLDVDIRIVLSWDADATDLDLHVIEPSGEKAYFGHQNTLAGGLVSQDITDGYGPEEYLIRNAPAGTYSMQTKYYGTRRQTLLGPATATITIYTDWGRPNEKMEILTVRLENARDLIPLGEIHWGGTDAGPVPVEYEPDVAQLRIGMPKTRIMQLFGFTTPAATLHYTANGKTLTFTFDEADQLRQVTETRPGNLTTILLQ